MIERVLFAGILWYASTWIACLSYIFWSLMGGVPPIRSLKPWEKPIAQFVLGAALYRGMGKREKRILFTITLSFTALMVIPRFFDGSGNLALVLVAAAFNFVLALVAVAFLKKVEPRF